MRWPKRRPESPRRDDAERELMDARRELEEARSRRLDTERVVAALTRLAEENHFGETFEHLVRGGGAK